MAKNVWRILFHQLTTECNDRNYQVTRDPVVAETLVLKLPTFSWETQKSCTCSHLLCSHATLCCNSRRCCFQGLKHIARAAVYFFIFCLHIGLGEQLGWSFSLFKSVPTHKQLSRAIFVDVFVGGSFFKSRTVGVWQDFCDGFRACFLILTPNLRARAIKSVTIFNLCNLLNENKKLFQGYFFSLLEDIS